MPGAASTTRRQLIRRAAVYAGLGTAGPSLDSLLSAAPAPAQGQGETDTQALLTLLAVEQLTIVVYERAHRSGRLSPRTQRLASKLLGHETAHARTLELELRRRGQSPPPKPAGTGEADRALARLHVSRSLTTLHGEPDWIGLMLDVEAAAEAAYYDAMSKLGDPGLLRIAAEVLASEAQHATLLSQVLYPGKPSKAVPDAFVEGKR
jgi:ferritin-like protein